MIKIQITYLTQILFYNLYYLIIWSFNKSGVKVGNTYKCYFKETKLKQKNLGNKNDNENLLYIIKSCVLALQYVLRAMKSFLILKESVFAEYEISVKFEDLQ
ncbi:hypothetical protein EDEG_01059 [Edhazardia aedis USNM 41457]|uniref:Transmembrane protein n=1 Tax=Edhazardia aedis (strain USNM 41457) TaxID=1003232 RepID=J9DBA0_EDHAE|nr:hypothetical protein EDEG_01059 [Edhazardia aedis USNM 41457]|eukprot:EJW04769.1 hypothetical protein EDEG_01059 [Edhazardia aedis USNM 41457]